jgi:hypothetical protein
MSLKVWLPLDGDLRNNGTLGVAITNNGATINVSGKIGQCYQFDNNSSYIDLNHSELYNILNGSTQPFSICFWVYQADTSRAIIFGDFSVTGGKNFNIELTTGHALRWYWGTPDIVISAMNVGLNTWTHITFTYSGTVLKGYVNGIEKYTNTITLAEKNRTTGSYYLGRDGRTGVTTLNGKLNDFRIYDHCLSAAEVKEIAKGLVLHYKLDSSLFGNPNLVLGSGTTAASTNKWTGHSATGGNTSTFEYDNNTPCIRVTRDNVAQSSWDFLSYDRLLQSQIKTNTTYTVTFDCKPEADGSIGFTGFVNGNATNSLTASTTNVQNNCYANKWNHMIYKCVTKSSFDGLTIGSQVVYFSRSASLRAVNVSVLFKNIKVEEGDVETPWCPADSELDIDRTIISDSSGYGHNGTILNTVTTSSDTPRYNSSTSLVADNSAINCGRGGMVTDSITVNFWLKSSGWGNPVSCTEGGGWNFEASGDYFRFPVYISGVGYKLCTSTVKRTDLCNNQWHMLTGIYDRLNGHIKIYVDGELNTDFNAETTNVIGYNGTNVIWLGAEASGSATAFAGKGMKGLFSDFRIYCTPLLDTDIKLLYNVGSRIDNLGGVHSFELEEKDNNLLAGTLITFPFNNKVNPYTKYNSNGEMYFDTNSTSAGSSYISINPTNHTYYYDFDISVNAGNQFYIGFERYDADKTSRSNNATVYIYSTKATEDVNHKHIFGTVNLSTDGVNPCAFIALRILNGWSGTNSGVIGAATIHSMSLREISSIQNPKLYKNGILSTGEFKEYQKASFYKNGFVEATEFIEI